MTTKYQYGHHVEFTTDIIEGYLVHALKGEAAEITKAYGHTGGEWIVHTTRGKLLKVNERQIKYYGE